ncbi:DUF1697 domain-containing protein [Demequina lignilytica]|uniref:DUF1697 domain-containing protein n=1 Tax=Demequina lignilytica TaxID=3051663 RepID=A0AAW7M7L1_9MICO|nr:MULTISPECIES: DUF1697 domain-containing protein [unclassified Demequina]MDN4479080.1 DUF1697 domain-containing protein [Demequina sp. SYSU T00039-1]MDN4484381.1 DUF1697 domain-containing protein [Demequina sp. SYSU T0a273]MDN4489001.1 DUF1697 domain-containing protein [Demequina sp. SYSU T00039]MDN4491288.1 DUF1697 domain-containing protein [Demequina sp. SYSU T00068]
MATTHVVLIRAINVGGRNKVPMAELRASLEAAGLRQVRTYIQSGNVLVDAGESRADQVNSLVERVLLADFDVDTVVVTVDAATMRGAVEGAPSRFGAEPDVYHSDVAFLRPGIAASEAADAFSLREGVDTLWEGEGVVYFRRLSAQRTKSRMSSVMGTPMYKQMTIRNWATTTTLVGMLDG